VPALFPLAARAARQNTLEDSYAALLAGQPSMQECASFMSIAMEGSSFDNLTEILGAALAEAEARQQQQQQHLVGDLQQPGDEVVLQPVWTVSAAAAELPAYIRAAAPASAPAADVTAATTVGAVASHVDEVRRAGNGSQGMLAAAPAAAAVQAVGGQHCFGIQSCDWDVTWA
jgi:hypothetical protein